SGSVVSRADVQACRYGGNRNGELLNNIRIPSTADQCLDSGTKNVSGVLFAIIPPSIPSSHYVKCHSWRHGANCNQNSSRWRRHCWATRNKFDPIRRTVESDALQKVATAYSLLSTCCPLYNLTKFVV